MGCASRDVNSRRRDGKFLEERGEVGDRAKYVRFRMLAPNKPIEATFQTLKDELAHQRPRFMKNVGRLGGGSFEKSQVKAFKKSAYRGGDPFH